MSKALEAAHEAGVRAFENCRPIEDGLIAYRDELLAHLAEDEELTQRLADVIADAMNMNRAGRLEHEAALAVLRTLAGKE